MLATPSPPKQLEHACSASSSTGSAIPSCCESHDWKEVPIQLPTGLSVPSYWWEPEVLGAAPTSSLSTGAVLCLHGAGDCGLVWSQVARQLLSDRRLGGIPIVAVDLRGHGQWVVDETLSESLNLDRLVQDVLALVRDISRRVHGQGLILCGHSLGGSLATHSAAEALKQRPALPVRAVVLLEAVEGTATEVLPRAASWLEARPRSFQRLEEAIAWALSSGMLHRETVAQETLPPRLKLQEDGSWHWITDVASAVSCWPSWFRGLSSLFVSLPLPKLLVVGGLDRLDAALEAAHMQGKFRLDLVQHPGHQIHEDCPGEIAEAIAKFLNGLKQQEAAFAKLQASASPSSTQLLSNVKRHRVTDPAEALPRSANR